MAWVDPTDSQLSDISIRPQVMLLCLQCIRAVEVTANLTHQICWHFWGSNSCRTISSIESLTPLPLSHSSDFLSLVWINIMKIIPVNKTITIFRYKGEIHLDVDKFKNISHPCGHCKNRQNRFFFDYSFNFSILWIKISQMVYFMILQVGVVVTLRYLLN